MMMMNKKYILVCASGLFNDKLQWKDRRRKKSVWKWKLITIINKLLRLHQVLCIYLYISNRRRRKNALDSINYYAHLCRQPYSNECYFSFPFNHDRRLNYETDLRKMNSLLNILLKRNSTHLENYLYYIQIPFAILL
jgi:hypothetical protein